ncbi:MAG: hypothetical protein R3220_09105 [Balneolaceae bacterium]|nr:hypothetical protein [Balneolaceae bacterium]
MRLYEFTTNDMLLYHGTSSDDFDSFDTKDVYLTDDEEQAFHYAKSAHLGGRKIGDPKVLTVAGKQGKTLEADEIVDSIIADEHEEFRDLDDLMKWARSQGYRYVFYHHPNVGNNDYHKVWVSLYPNQDLEIIDIN